MNKLSVQKRSQILALMAEGCSMRSITRLTECSKNTVSKLLIDAGTAMAQYQDKTLINLTCKKIQVDEIWSFCYSKQKNVATAKTAPEGSGDVWTWVAIDAETKLVPCWLVGKRDADYANKFINDLAARLINRVQLSSDGLKSYIEAIEEAFGNNIDYAMLVKIYGENKEKQKRYNPDNCVGIKKNIVMGNPNDKHISTSFSERQNLNIRMGNRRFTRLTNAFSKKIDNHAHSMALYFMHYNFVRIHQTLRITPAMAAGVTNKLWSFEDIVAILLQWEEKYR